MADVTLQVLDGVDRGKVFYRLITPVSIGREEGNSIQLNDERVSRYHAKIQEDQGQLVLTDLESTNGTRVNGEPVPLMILRVGDRIALGRSVLLVGSPEELDHMMGMSAPASASGRTVSLGRPPSDKTRPASITDQIQTGDRSDELKFQLNFHSEGESPAFRHDSDVAETTTPRSKPDLPQRLSPAQAAQLAELLLHLHQSLATAVDEVLEHADDGYVRMSQATWQKILRVEMDLARYHYRVGHPE